MRILSVDDRDENRYLVEALLRGNGHEVHSVANGAEALAKLQTSLFDLIISDILMPVMDGFELCRRVKADENLRDIPFIVYTATYTGPQDEAFAMKIGADRFIQKPCEPEIFMEAIREVMAAAKDGNLVGSSAPALPEEEVLKLYSERLVRKLEQKMLQLEKEVQARQNAEEVLRQSEKKYKSLYNSIRDAILVSDINRRIIDCNPAFVDLFGYSLAEIAGKQTVIVYENEEQFRQLGRVLKDHSDDDSSLLYTVHFKKKDGSVFPGEVNIFFLRNDERTIIGFIGLIRDITERVQAEKTQKNLESQLHQAQKMESVGRLAGGVAHDFNNMLSVILGYAQLALIKADPGSSLHDDLQEILAAALRSVDITRQLLAFARKQTIAPQVLDLNETVKGMHKMLLRLLGEDVDLAWIPTPNLWPVKIDPSQIDQLLANLCVNARDAITGTGRIIIETSMVTFDTLYCAHHSGFFPGEYVLLTVSDDGFGMEKELLEKIFEPFFTTKESGKGTGLGLATVYGIVKQNNGFINVYSEPGKGTTFKIYFPRFAGQAIKIEQPNNAPIECGRGETVLVVEDEAAILKFTARMLKELGYSVLTAGGSAEAVSLAKGLSTPLDLLITDVIMPEMNGKDLADRLLSLYPNLKCLFMSGYTASIIAGQGVLDEGMHFIQKPFSANDLAVKIRKVLHSEN
jgi:two-component system, cell cycle sensor histidine kinase and response regulator CckA